MGFSPLFCYYDRDGEDKKGKEPNYKRGLHNGGGIGRGKIWEGRPKAYHR